ncbi:MAG: hypothetical protein HXY22_09295 [Alphaproteobacteria bacterium]|nr:hypothetical protein [Alphaproteobacteria bacterium]
MSQPRPRLPLRVFDTVQGIYRLAFEHAGVLVRLSWLSAALSVVATAGAAYILPPLLGVDLSGAVSQVIDAAFGAVIAAGVHRFVIHGHRPVSFYYFRATREEALFMIAALLFLAAWVAGNALVSAVLVALGLVRSGEGGALAVNPVAGAISVITLATGLYFTVRASLVFPVITAEHRASFSRAIALTGGRFFGVFGIYFLASLPALAILFLLSGLISPIVFEVKPDQSVAVRPESWWAIGLFQFVGTIIAASISGVTLARTYLAITAGPRIIQAVGTSPGEP